MRQGWGNGETQTQGDAGIRESAAPRLAVSPRRRITDYWRQAVQQLIAAGIEAEEARLEAEVLLRHVLGIERAAFLGRWAEEIPADAAGRFSALLQRRLAREPLAYIVGQREFYGLSLLVDARVLIPRPETEGLVERGIAAAASVGATLRGRPDGALTIVDVGTGSGCIAVALAGRLPEARLIATDASADALAVARENARRHGVEEQITFLHGDLLFPLGEIVDIMLANPPYIPSAELAALPPEISRFEPRAALDGGPDGLEAIRRLLVQAPAHVRPGGVILLEIGTGQGRAVVTLAHAAFPGARVSVDNDLAGLERYVTIAI